MSEIIEAFKSRRETVAARSPTAELIYYAKGYEDEAAVAAAIEATAPATYNDLVLRSYEISERLSDDTWLVTVKYDQLGPDDEGYTEDVNVDATTETQHVNQSLSVVNSYALSGTPPDSNGAIGFDGEKVNGVDIIVPKRDFEITQYFDNEEYLGYEASWLTLVGSVNSDNYRGWLAGEILFRGFTSRLRGTDLKWEVTFKFSHSPNETGLTIGGITGVAKDGWDYLDVRYASDVSQNSLIQKPVNVYVHRVYPRESFADLP
jgi:hypothetical protein